MGFIEMIDISSLIWSPAGIGTAVEESQFIPLGDVVNRHPLDQSVLPGHQAEIGVV
jgi:hypothetical protein